MLLILKSSAKAAIAKKSFFRFVQEFWPEVVQEKPVWNWHIEYMCDEIQKVAERVFNDLPKKYDLIINQPPGTTKSIPASIMFTGWVWSNMPNARLLNASNADLLGERLSRLSRNVVESERYQSFYPSIRLIKDQNTKTYFVNNTGGERLYCTVGGKSPIGFHAHFHTVDDPIDPQGIRSTRELINAEVFMTEVLSERKVRQDMTPLIMVMQRLHQEDPTGMRLKRKKDDPVRHIRLPATDEYKVKPKRLRKKYKKGLLDPQRLNRKVLDQKKAKGQFFYAGQYGEDPVPLGGGMFKTEKLKIAIIPPVDLESVVRYWDRGATADDGAHTVGVKMGKRRLGNTKDSPYEFWILDVRRGQWATDERDDVIEQTAEMDTKDVIIGQEEEGGSSGKDQSRHLVKRLAGFRVKTDRPTGDKVVRADPFSVQVNAGNVTLVQGEWNNDYMNELKAFPDSLFKDQVDASSGAFKLLTEERKRMGGVVL